MIIVSGLARSGTSLMMNMLGAGGIEVFTDGVRVPNESNPNGYSEVEAIGKKLQANNSYLSGRTGCCKVLSPFLRHLHGEHKIIYMERDMKEIATSMEKMSGQPVTPLELAALERHVESTKQMLHERDRGFVPGSSSSRSNSLSTIYINFVPGSSSSRSNSLSTIYINYNQLVTSPGPEVKKLEQFVPELNIINALSAIDKRLYRNRNPCHQ